MPTYYTNDSVSIRDDSGNYIPIDTGNSDYQAYLAWVAAGNTIVTTSPPSGGDSVQIAGNVWTDVSAVFGGTSGRILYNNAGVLGELASSGTGNVVRASGATATNLTLSGTLTASGGVGASEAVLASTGAGVTWSTATGTGNVVRKSSALMENLALDGSLIVSNGAGTSGQVLTSTGTGVQWSSTSIVPILADGRLTLSSNTPVVQPNASSATTLYYTPYLGNRITLYSGSLWEIVTFSQLSIAVPSTSNTNYDVYVYNNSGTATLELTAWTNDTTRATALTTQDGVLVKTGATTRRYIGTVRTNPTSGQMSDEPSQRHVWNMYNRVAAHFYAGTTGNYNYTTATWRSAGNITTLGLSRVQWVCGQNTHVALTNYQVIYNATATVYAAGGIGFDRTNNNDAQILGTGITSGDWPAPSTAFYDAIVTPGYHYGQRVEYSEASGTTAWYQSTTAVVSGMRGIIFC